jgi:UDP-glucose 4-epimerase
MKMVITGGAGFIGSHLCEKYTREGHTVVCLDNFLNGNLGNLRALLHRRNFKLVVGDIRDYDLLERNLRDAELVIHLAAQIHVDRSIIEPRLTYDINVIGTLNLLELARRFDTERFIYASSSEVYGSAQYVPMDEAHPLCAPHLYGATKAAADRLCFAYIQTYDANVCIMRPFNTFGPRQKDSGYGGAISMFVKRALAGRPPIIYGDGSQTRDYLYVNDLLRAFDMIIESKKPLQEPLNFGTGREVHVLDLANQIVALCGTTVRPVQVEARPGEVKRLVADYSKAREILGWQPQYSLEQGLKEFITWYMTLKSEEWEKPG